MASKQASLVSWRQSNVNTSRYLHAREPLWMSTFVSNPFQP
jgi:hypothetical protein